MNQFSASKRGWGLVRLGAFTLFLLIFSGVYPGKAQAVPGALDLSFANQGLEASSIGDENLARSIALQPDGKILVGGSGILNGHRDFYLRRFNSNGSVDTSFNPNGSFPGLVVTDISGSGSGDVMVDIAVLPDGKILAFGGTDANGSGDFVVARYEEDGDLDTSFNSSGTPGFVITDFSGAGSVETVAALAVQPDGKIVAVGATDFDDDGDRDWAIARYTSEGVLDTTFNPLGTTPGLVVKDVDGDLDFLNAVAIQESDGKIVVAGTVSLPGNLAVARYNSDGNLDTAFNAAGTIPGIAFQDFSGNDDFDVANDVKIQADGKIVAGGAISSHTFLVVRYNTDGTLDPTFNAAGPLPGTVETRFSNFSSDAIQALALQPDGKIVVAGGGGRDLDGNTNFALARYNSDGTLDVTTFNPFVSPPGLVQTDFGSDEDEEVMDIAIQPDGKIVATGSTVSADVFIFALARYLGDDADLSITKTASATSVAVGDPVTYTITVTNQGSPSAGGVVIKDILTGAITFGAISITQGTCSGTNDLTCNVGILDSGASVTLTVPVTTTTVGGISNVASVKGNGLDPDSTNNLAFAVVNVSETPGPGPAPGASADLSISKTASPSAPKVGDLVTYTLTVSNQGPDSADGVVVTDVLFGSFTDLSASASQGTCTVSGPVTCNLGNLAGGASAVVTVRLKVGDFGPLSDLATVVSQTGDPNLSNNSAALNFTVNTATAGGSGCALGNPAGFGSLWIWLGSIPFWIGLRSGRSGSIVKKRRSQILKTLSVSIFLSALSIGFSRPALAVPGALDLTFGNLGFVVTDFAGDNDRANGLAIQPDGKIVATGIAFVDGDEDFAVARYNPDGSLDSTFNPSGTIPGIVTTDVSGDDDFGEAVALQDDGKIVVAGTADVSGNEDFAVVRYEADGDLDTTFNPSGSTPGVVTTEVSGNSDDDRAAGVAIHDGKIVVAGVSRGGGGNDFAVVRYEEDGDPDPTFNSTGIVVTDASGTGDDDDGTAVAIQADGRIVVAGFLSVGANDDFVVARYEGDGDLDSTFNSTGIQITDFTGSGSFDRAFAVALQPDEKIVVAGFFSDLSDNEYAVARYETDGDLDPTFNSTGLVTTDFTGEDDVAHAVAIQPDGKIVVAGFFSDDDFSIDNFSMARYNTDGTLDTATFNNSGPVPGLAITDFFSFALEDHAFAVAIQADGKIVLAGESGAGGTPNFALARYQGNTADLSIVKSASASSVMVGDAVTYTITVTNNGPQSADGVVLTDVLSGAVAFGSISTSQGSCNGSQELMCDLGSLANGASATVTVPVTTTASGGISNIAKVTGSAADPNSTNNLALAFVNVSTVPEPPEPPPPSADLSITKSVDVTSPGSDDLVTYSIRVTNQGPDTADGVTLTDALFGSFSELRANASQGACTVSGAVVCNLGSLANGASATVTVLLQTGDFGAISNLATVVSQTNDPEFSNNSVGTHVTINPADSNGGGDCALSAAGDFSGAWAYFLSIPVLIGLRTRRKKSEIKA